VEKKVVSSMMAAIQPLVLEQSEGYWTAALRQREAKRQRESENSEAEQPRVNKSDPVADAMVKQLQSELLMKLVDKLSNDGQNVDDEWCAV
jgi:hypothetical protein